MGKSIVKCAFVIVLAFVGMGSLHAQSALQSDWDSVLDRYGQICEQCISLKSDIQNGVQVPAAKVSSLFQELALLRNSLQNASGQMTDSQRERFSSIRDRYQNQFDKSQDNNETVQESVQPPVAIKTHDEQQKHTVPEIITSELIQPLTIPALSESFPDIIVCNFDTCRQTGYPSVPAPVTALRQWRVHVMGTIDFGSVTQYGMALAMGKGKIGLFIGAQSNLRNVSADYDCHKDGTIPGGGFFWGDGSLNESRSRLLAGLHYSPFDFLQIYATSGVCSDNTYWRDSNGGWARVSDLSGKGALFGLGVIVPVWNLSLTSGIQYDCFAKAVTVDAGIGFNFSF